MGGAQSLDRPACAKGTFEEIDSLTKTVKKLGDIIKIDPPPPSEQLHNEDEEDEGAPDDKSPFARMQRKIKEKNNDRKTKAATKATTKILEKQCFDKIAARVINAHRLKCKQDVLVLGPAGPSINTNIAMSPLLSIKNTFDEVIAEVKKSPEERRRDDKKWLPDPECQDVKQEKKALKNAQKANARVAKQEANTKKQENREQEKRSKCNTLREKKEKTGKLTVMETINYKTSQCDTFDPNAQDAKKKIHKCKEEECSSIHQNFVKKKICEYDCEQKENQKERNRIEAQGMQNIKLQFNTATTMMSLKKNKYGPQQPGAINVGSRFSIKNAKEMMRSARKKASAMGASASEKASAMSASASEKASAMSASASEKASEMRESLQQRFSSSTAAEQSATAAEPTAAAEPAAGAELELITRFNDYITTENEKNATAGTAAEKTNAQEALTFLKTFVDDDDTSSTPHWFTSSTTLEDLCTKLKEINASSEKWREAYRNIEDKWRVPSSANLPHHQYIINSRFRRQAYNIPLPAKKKPYYVYNPKTQTTKTQTTKTYFETHDAKEDGYIKAYKNGKYTVIFPRQSPLADEEYNGEIVCRNDPCKLDDRPLFVSSPPSDTEKTFNAAFTNVGYYDPQKILRTWTTETLRAKNENDQTNRPTRYYTIFTNQSLRINPSHNGYKILLNSDENNYFIDIDTVLTTDEVTSLIKDANHVRVPLTEIDCVQQYKSISSNSRPAGPTLKTAEKIGPPHSALKIQVGTTLSKDVERKPEYTIRLNRNKIVKYISPFREKKTKSNQQQTNQLHIRDSLIEIANRIIRLMYYATRQIKHPRLNVSQQGGNQSRRVCRNKKVFQKKRHTRRDRLGSMGQWHQWHDHTRRATKKNHKKVYNKKRTLKASSRQAYIGGY
jgi:hypothetical protein